MQKHQTTTVAPLKSNGVKAHVSGSSSLYELTVIEGLTNAQAERVKKHWHEYLPTVELNIYEGYSEKENRFRCTIKISREATHISLILLGKLLRGVEDKSICP